MADYHGTEGLKQNTSVSFPPGDLASATLKARRRLIPLLFLVYIVAYLDRINVAFASLRMNETLGFSARTYGLGAGIFFLSYVLFEIPSNMILARVGARLWIARIMITWGVVSSGMMFVRGAGGFYAMRFLLGAAEAGFFPGIIFYLTRWFPARELARTIAAFMTAVVVAGIIGGPVSGLLLSLHGAWGLEGWQWLFLLEGLPAVVLGFIVLTTLTERPEHASWLTADERLALADCLASESALCTVRTHTVRAALTSGRIWLLAVVYFTIPVALYGMSFWLPQILKTASRGSDFEVGLLSAVPYAVAALGMVVTSRHSDRTNERRWHVAIAALVGGVSLAASAFVQSLVPSLVLLSLAMLGVASMFGPFWTLTTATVEGIGAAAGIALVNSVGNVGGFVGPYLLGYVRDVTQSFAAGLVCIGALLVGGGVLALLTGKSR
jgi:ACS family tartrate transporter-like MFS transporter